MSGFPGHPITPPAGDFPILAGQNWDDTSLRWTYDLFCNVIGAAVIRPESSYPCPAPYPCGEVNFRPHRFEVMTLHPVRFRDRIGEPGTENRELMEYTFAYTAMSLNARFVPLLFSIKTAYVENVQVKDEEGRVTYVLAPERNWQVSLGSAFVAQAGDPTGLLRPGRWAVVFSLPVPRWRAVVLSSSRRYCEIQT